MTTITHARLPWLAVVTAVLACGCASMSSPSPAQSGAGAHAASTPTPRVENCAVVNIGSPSKFACNDKVYTTFELAKLREQAEKKGASGK